jgi:heme-degrading monooxygenase HmoA
MPTISPDTDLVTVMVRFAVDPQDQPLLLELLAQTNPVLTRQPGFVSAATHRSLDGTEVLVYLQWRSVADHEACVQNIEMNEASAGLMDFINAGRTRYEVHMYEVTSALLPE